MILLSLLLTAPVATPVPQNCEYDRRAMLALDWRAFDQDMSGGWRKLANAGCDLVAAELIETWRRNGEERLRTMVWHEGQLRANAGQNEPAIALFERTRRPAEADARIGWNHYVDGSIAFLRRDRKALVAARGRLAAVPPPSTRSMLGPDGKPRKIDWPMNLKVLDGFLQCWGQPYRIAYTCRPATPPHP